MSEFKDKLVSILDVAYPDRYELTGKTDLLLTLHFPEITIRNSRGSSRLLRDMFVRFGLNENGITSSFSGMRTTFTLDEAYSGYDHSHLPGGGFINGNSFRADNAIRFNRFCTGSGPFAIMLSDLHRRMDIDKLEQFLMFIPTYLAWESLEGGPYKRMSNIQFPNTNSDRNNNYHHSTADIDRVVQCILANMLDVPLKIEDRYGKKRFLIDYENEDFFKTVEKISPILKYNNGLNQNYYHQIPGTPGSTGSSVYMSNRQGPATFKLGKKEIPIQILPREEAQTTPQEGFTLKLPKHTFQSACDRLNTHLNNYYITHELQ